MSFNDFINENNDQYTLPTIDQLSILRHDIDRSSYRMSFEKQYIDKNDLNVSLFNNDIYISGISLGKNDNVFLKTFVIIEVTEEDNYIYYKFVEVIYNADEKSIDKITENDKFRDENWKTIQSKVLANSKKL